VLTGKIKRYDTAKGYGFITRDDGEADVFLHVTNFQESTSRCPAIGSNS
jgi:cold shock CspA family protein